MIIVFPFGKPFPGGSAIYLDILLDIVNRIVTEPITIISEAIDEKLIARKNYSNRLMYVPVQKYFIRKRTPLKPLFLALQVISLAYKIFKYSRHNEIIWIHSAFFIKNTPLAFILKYIKRFKRLNIVIDMRDPAIPSNRIRALKCFDRFVVCSEELRKNAIAEGIAEDCVQFIPVPVNDIAHSEFPVCSDVKNKYGIKNRYVYNSNGINERKSFNELYDAWRGLIDAGYVVDLVISGNAVGDVARYSECNGDKGAFVYTGSLDHREVLSLIRCADLVPNPSKIEALPRMSIEACLLNRPVLLPGYISKFAKLDGRFLWDNDHAITKMIDLLGSGNTPNLDFSDYKVERVQSLYKKTITDLIA